MDRAQKAAVVAELETVFDTAGAVIVCHYAGLTVAQMADLRLRMRQAGGAVRVAKNRLAKIALKGKVSEGMSVHLNGQTVLIYSEDPVAPAKVAEDYAKKNEKLVILGGAMGGEILDRKGVESLSKMPSREEMLGRIAAALMGPGARLAGALKGPGGRVAGAIKSIAEKEEA